MANHKDAIKRDKQNEKRRMRNKAYRTQMRNQIKKLRAAVTAGDKDAAQAEFKVATSIIHRIAGKGIIHRNLSARRISRLNTLVKNLVLGTAEA